MFADVRTALHNDALRTQTRERILTAAMRLFAGKGFGGVSVRMLAEEAGISVGLMYRHFDSLEDVLIALFAESMDQVRGTFPVNASPVDAAGAFEGLLRAAVETTLRHREFWALSYAVRHQADVQRLLAPHLSTWTAEILGQFQKLAAPGPGAAARGMVLFALVDGVCQHAVLNHPNHPTDEVVAAAVEAARAILQRSLP